MIILQWLVVILTAIIFIFSTAYNSLFLAKIDGYYYKGPFKTVYYQTDFEGAKFYGRLDGATSDNFKVIRCDIFCYGSDKDRLYYHSSFIKDADPDTFRFFSDDWMLDDYARDKSAVFYLNDGVNPRKLEGVNPDEFTHVSGEYWKSKDVYYKNGEISQYLFN